MLTKQEIILRIFVVLLIIGGGAFLLGYLRDVDVGFPPNGEFPSVSPFPTPSSSGISVSGPGGCSTLEECVLFCRDNPASCFALQSTPPSSSPAPYGTPTPTNRTLFPSISLPTLTPPILFPASPEPGFEDVEPTAEELAALEEFSRTLDTKLDRPLEQPGPNGCRTVRQCQNLCSSRPSLCQGWLFANFPTR